MIDRLLRAEDLGVRLEIVSGLPIWEPTPLYRHQKAVDRIRASIQPPGTPEAQARCRCVHTSDVYIQFPDGSLKRPDIAIFCEEPPEEDAAIRIIPAAVVEVVSKGYEAKDLEIAPHFYLAQGVLDVLVFDPYSLLVLHARKDRTRREISPVPVDLECGCRLTA